MCSVISESKASSFSSAAAMARSKHLQKDGVAAERRVWGCSRAQRERPGCCMIKTYLSTESFLKSHCDLESEEALSRGSAVPLLPGERTANTF